MMQRQQRRIPALLLAMVCLAGLLALPVLAAPARAADSGTCGDNAFWTLDDSGTLTISGTGKMNVDGVEMPWDSSMVKTVIIADGITYICGLAFYGCTNLTSVTIPDSVTKIEIYAFSESGLTSVTIPNSVTAIGDSVFYGCKNLADITIPNSVTEIGIFAFSESGLTSVIISDSVTTIGMGAFSDCTDLSDIYFLGDAPIATAANIIGTSPNGRPFSRSSFPSTVTLYYIEGKAGWTSPEWNGYKTAVWDGVTSGGGAAPAIPAAPPAGSSLPFLDVAPSDWHYSSVAYVYQRGLMSGVAGDWFAWGENTSRGQIATLAHRMAGQPAAGEYSGFEDVPAGQWYSAPITWAKEQGLIVGLSEQWFGVNDPVTREQLAAILYRYAGYKGLDVFASNDLTAFGDGWQVSPWATDAVAWAVDKGMLNGVGGNLIAPQDLATRAQIAAILQRFCETFGV